MKNITPEQLVAAIEEEGIGYAVKEYYGKILCLDDPKLETIWNECYEKLTYLDQYLYNKYPEYYED